MSSSLRPMPTETVSGLAPPLADFPYFAGADSFCFQSRPGQYSAINAWWLADASFLVYGKADFIERELEKTPLPRLGFELAWIGSRNENRGIVLSSQEALIVVFRGTRIHQHSMLDAAELVMIDRDDLLLDSNFLPAACAAGGTVHEGFLSGFSEASEELDSIIGRRRESQSLWLTGHSLGGALAVLAATHLNEHSIQGVYTYGAPRVGDAKFAALLPEHLQYRFVHRDDWVPTLPPEMIGYRHGGRLRPVTGSGARSLLDDVTSGAQDLLAAVMSMASELKIDVGRLPMKISGFADHAPIYYATLLWNSLVEDVGANS